MNRRVHRPDLIVEPRFWQAYFWNITRGPLAEGDVDHADVAFGYSAADVEEFYLEELRNEMVWPFVRLLLPQGYWIDVEYSNVVDDHELRFYCGHASWSSSLLFAKGGGHWHLPGLRWEELLGLSRVAEIWESSEDAKAFSALLLLPATWLSATDDLPAVTSCLSDFLGVLDIPQMSPMALAGILVSSSRANIAWHRHDALGWINDCQNSRRNPSSAVTFGGEEFARVSAMLSSINGTA